MKFQSSIAGVSLDGVVGNASGPCDTTWEELDMIARSDSAMVMMKSCTLESREGNPEPRYAQLPYGSLQSMGLPNLGYKQYLKIAKKLKSLYDKPVVASIAGFSLDEYVTMVRAFQDQGVVDLIEVNLSCPNIVGKSQVAYDLAASEEVISAVSGLGDIPVGLKLPPYYERQSQEAMGALCLRYGVGFVTLINSIGNCLVIDVESEAPVIRPKGGRGGLGGSYIKPVALANVRMFYEIFRGEVSIFGVGGVSSGNDVFEYLLAGADGVQVGTAFEKEGVEVFGRIEKEFGELMARKGYRSLADVRGMLRDLV